MAVRRAGRRIPHHLGWTIRLRLTLLYGALFFVSGVALLTLTYVLAAHTLPWATIRSPTPPTLRLPGGLPAPEVPALHDQLARQRAKDFRQMLMASGIALVLTTFASGGLGWLTAGRVLRPLRTMTRTTRTISARDLHRRLDVQGPADEIKDLADTFDDLLDHLDDAFEAQRRFVANASHELRTPLAYERSVLEVALADPDASAADLRSACNRVLSNNEQQEKLIEALLTLARSQRGLARRADLDLAVLVDTVLDSVRAGDGHAPQIDAELNQAAVSGDPALVERLIANLVDNALRHNVSGGRATIWTGVVDGRSALRVSNTGRVIAPAQIDTLFQPFQRLHVTHVNGQDGLGLGLSIVAAIATAHDAELRAEPLPEGGLDVWVSFPLPVQAGRVDLARPVTCG